MIVLLDWNKDKFGLRERLLAGSADLVAVVRDDGEVEVLWDQNGATGRTHVFDLDARLGHLFFGRPSDPQKMRPYLDEAWDHYLKDLPPFEG
jgi:hypothetical protein